MFERGLSENEAAGIAAVGIAAFVTVGVTVLEERVTQLLQREAKG